MVGAPPLAMTVHAMAQTVHAEPLPSSISAPKNEGMYLIHVRLEGPGGSAGRPDLATIVASYAGKADGLEHIAVHEGPPRDVTLGFFLLADDLAAAEKTAAHLAEQAVSDHPELREFRIMEAEAVLVPGPWWGG